MRAMQGIRSYALVLLVALAARAQVLTVFEIKEPGARRLQQRYINELTAIGNELQQHQFPYSFYFSRALDIDEKQQQKLDQRSIRFDKFNGQTVLQTTGNYYAAYNDSLMDRLARTRRTYRDVIFPILKSEVPKFPSDDDFGAFAIEVSYHVRRRVMGIDTENPENLTLIVPREIAHHLMTATNDEQQQAALLDSEVYVNAEPFLLWLIGDQPPDLAKNSAKPKRVAASRDADTGEPEATVSATLLKPTLPARLVTPTELANLKATHQDTIQGMLHNLDAQAHFAKYAPPAFVAFHQGAYLQLSVSSPLPTANGSRYQLAALAFDEHISHLVRPVLAYFPEDGGFDGVSFSSILKVPGADSSEAVEFFFPFQALRCFASYDCTGQQLIDSGIVLINGERSELNLARVEALPPARK